MIRRPPRSTLFPYTNALPIWRPLLSAQIENGRGIHVAGALDVVRRVPGDRKSTRLNSSHVEISYAVFCLKKKKKSLNRNSIITSDKATPTAETRQSSGAITLS